MLTERQKLTIKHIQERFGYKTPEEYIKYCLKKLSQPRRTRYSKHPNAPRTERRDHSRRYYQDIIDYYVALR